MCRALKTLLLVVAFMAAAAQAKPQDSDPFVVPPAPIVAGKGYILIDHTTGKVLAESNADKLTEPASITKIMTAYTAFQALRQGEVSLDDEVLISKRAWYMRGSRMYIKGGEKVRFDDLLHGAIIRSGNDAATAIAEHVGGSVEKFVERMNAEAQRIGMVNTLFVSPSGLTHNKEFTTARDIATLSSRLIRDFPEHYHLFGEKQFRYKKFTLRNRNQLLADDSIDGIKTGFTNNAGYCLSASATDGPARFIAVVLGARTWQIRNKSVKTLLEYAKEHYETVRLYPGGQPLVSRRVWKGDVEQIGVGLERDVLLTLPRGQAQSVKAKMNINSYLTAPLNLGQNIGTVRIELDGKEIETRPVVALTPVSEGNLWRQVIDTLTLWFEPIPADATAKSHSAQGEDMSQHAALVW